MLWKKTGYFGRYVVLGIWGFMALGSLSLPVRAESAFDYLYKASLLVVDQGEAERQKSLKEGLEGVIVRMSGQTEFHDNAVITEALNNPDNYLQQFAYVSLSDAEKAEIKAAMDGKNRLELKSGTANKYRPNLPPTIRINLSFSPESVKALLRRAGLAIWPANRPSVLVWVVTDSGAGKHSLGQVDQGLLLKAAGERGLSVVLPMNDLKDQVILDVNRLWNMDQVAIAEASQRYGEDSVLVGRVSQTAPGKWQGNWLYLLKGQSWIIETNSDDLEGFLAQGVSEVVKIQVGRYGISPGGEPSVVSLDISGVDSVQKYANTLLYLKSLDPVRSVQVVEVDGDTLRCALQIDGVGEILRELVELGHVLVSVNGVAAEQKSDPVVTPVLHYRLSNR